MPRQQTSSSRDPSQLGLDQVVHNIERVKDLTVPELISFIKRSAQGKIPTLVNLVSAFLSLNSMKKEGTLTKEKLKKVEEKVPLLIMGLLSDSELCPILFSEKSTFNKAIEGLFNDKGFNLLKNPSELVVFINSVTDTKVKKAIIYQAIEAIKKRTTELENSMNSYKNIRNEVVSLAFQGNIQQEMLKLQELQKNIMTLSSNNNFHYKR